MNATSLLWDRVWFERAVPRRPMQALQCKERERVGNGHTEIDQRRKLGQDIVSGVNQLLVVVVDRVNRIKTLGEVSSSRNGCFGAATLSHLRHMYHTPDSPLLNSPQRPASSSQEGPLSIVNAIRSTAAPVLPSNSDVCAILLLDTLCSEARPNSLVHIALAKPILRHTTTYATRL